MMMPLAGVLLIVQGISECLKCVYAIRTGHWPAAATASVAQAGVAV